MTKAQIVTVKSQPKETATLFSIGADEIKALGHSSYLEACQSLIIATCCDSKINVSWRDTQANSEGGRFARMKLCVSTVLISSTAPAASGPFRRGTAQSPFVIMSYGWQPWSSGQSSDIQNRNKNLCLSFLLFFLWNLHWTYSHYSFALTALPKIFANFGHHGSSTFSVTGELVPCL